VRAKYGSADVMLMPADAGTGVIAGAAVRAVCEAAGIKNVITKSFNTGNQVTVVKATIEALKKLRTQQEVERLRGVTLT
jgi:small subunit ribosomal protein S5